jgi:hypothetical protein
MTHSLAREATYGRGYTISLHAKSFNVDLVDPIAALAHLQIGRAYAKQDGTAKARAAYQDFLTLWKDADPDIPILKQAKAEYSNLQ